MLSQEEEPYIDIYSLMKFQLDELLKMVSTLPPLLPKHLLKEIILKLEKIEKNKYSLTDCLRMQLRTTHNL